MLTISLQMPDLARFQAGLRAAANAVAPEMRTAMAEATLIVEAEGRTLAGQSRDTGRLQGSISSRITGSGLSLVGEIGPSVAYGLPVETGSRPHWPPRAPLEGWAARHGIPVFLVQRAIARRGTRAQPFMGPALERTRGRVEAVFSRIGARVFSRIQR